jgi:hypothetical protein
LRWKRLAAAQEAVIARIVRTSTDPEVRDLAGRISAVRSRLSRLVNLADPSPLAIKAKLRELGRLETRLTTMSRHFRAQQQRQAVSWKQVQAQLPPGSALVELRVYHPFDMQSGERGDARWLALVLPAKPDNHDSRVGETTPPRLFDLGPMEPAAKSAPGAWAA